MHHNTPHIEISLDNLLHNLSQIRSVLAPGQKVMAVVKDCAYGCGARSISRTLEENGVDFFAVARMEEAQDLRNAGLSSPVLVIGECSKEEAEWGAAHDVRITVNNIADIQMIAQLKSIGVHINIDTGMGRMGVLDTEAHALGEKLAKCKNATVEGLYTHFASADEPQTHTVSLQHERFLHAQKALKSHDIAPRIIHISNSAALSRFPMKNADYVRPGIMLYGCNPDPSQDFGLSLRCVASLKGPVVKLKKVAAGTAISYGGNYVTPQETYIATIAIGYANGLPRLLSSRGEVLIGGKRYRIAGNVTMDYIMADAGTTPPFAVGDEAVAIGYQGAECIHADDIAKKCGTIGYEILCGLSKRIDRHYYLKNKLIRSEPGQNY